VKNDGKTVRDPFDPDSGPRKWLSILWYFLIGSECIYHVFKGLYLTAYFSVYKPFMELINNPDSHMMLGQSLFSLAEWQYHFLYGLRGPTVLFGAYLLYKYTLYLSPFKKKKGRSGHHGGNRQSNQRQQPRQRRHGNR